jgi:hypothetical protein
MVAVSSSTVKGERREEISSEERVGKGREERKESLILVSMFGGAYTEV